MNDKLFDLHSDIGMNINRINNPHLLKDEILPKHIEGKIYYSIMASCFEGKEDLNFMITTLNKVNQQINECDYKLIKNKEDFKDQRSAIISIEGMCGLEKVEDIETFYDLNVRVASLCWNDANKLCAGKDDHNKGLSELGKKVINRMNELKMIIDVSHANEKSFYDILNTSKRPIIATHSNAYSLCPNVRNLKDEQLLAIKENGGIIGCVAYPNFIDGSEEMNLSNFVKHIKYISDLIGIDHVCLGFDFLEYFEDRTFSYHVRNAYILFDELRKANFNEEEIKKISFMNAYNFIKNNI